MAFIKKYLRTNFRRYATFHFHIRFDSAFRRCSSRTRMIIDLFISKLPVPGNYLPRTRFTRFSLKLCHFETFRRRKINDRKIILEYLFESNLYNSIDLFSIPYSCENSIQDKTVQIRVTNIFEIRNQRSTRVPSGRVPVHSTRKPRLKINELERLFLVRVRYIVKCKINFTRVSFPRKIHTVTI